MYHSSQSDQPQNFIHACGGGSGGVVIAAGLGHLGASLCCVCVRVCAKCVAGRRDCYQVCVCVCVLCNNDYLLIVVQFVPQLYPLLPQIWRMCLTRL